MVWIRSEDTLSLVKLRNRRKLKTKLIFEGFNVEEGNVVLLPSGDMILNHLESPSEENPEPKTLLIFQGSSRPSHQIETKKDEKMIELFELSDLKKINPQVETELKIVLAEINDRVTSMSIITNRGMIWPKVIENGEILSKPNFIEAHSNDTRIEMTLGTSQGDCMKLQVLFDSENNIKKQHLEKVVSHWAPAKNYLEPKEENELELLSTATTDVDGHAGIMGQRHSGINAFQKFTSHEAEIFLFCSKPRLSKKCDSQTNQTLAVFARSKYEPWTKLDINLNAIIEVREEQFFRLLQIDRDSTQNAIRFCVYNRFALILIEYDVSCGLLTLLKLLPLSMAEKQDIMYSEKMNQFYIPMKRSIQIWDGLLQILQTTVEFESDLLQTSFVSKPNQLIFAYDRCNYYELDLDSLEPQRKIPFASQPGSPFYINSDLFPAGRSINIPEQFPLFGSVQIIGENDPLELMKFPFEAFPKCFQPDVYKAAVLEYAEYYFQRLKETDNRDLYYGPLSPVLLAVFHNDTDLLTQILHTFGYPASVRSYWSALSFSFRFNFPSTMKILCDHIFKHAEQVNISRQDFIFLLNSQKDFCHRLLSRVPSKPNIPYIPSLVSMSEDTNLVYVPSINDLMDLLKDNELSTDMRLSTDARDRAVSIQGYRSTNLQRRRSVFDRFQDDIFSRNCDNKSKSEVEILQVSFQYDYRAGTPDSIRLLDMYAKSENEEFISSAWKEVISEKWDKIWLFHLGFSFLYFTFTVILTISLVFHPTEAHFSDEVSKVFIFIFFIYEIIQLVSYAFYNINKSFLFFC